MLLRAQLNEQIVKDLLNSYPLVVVLDELGLRPQSITLVHDLPKHVHDQQARFCVEITR